MSPKGAYFLCISIEEELEISVGALGRLYFPPGRYLYIGSALNGLEARILRHINTDLGINKVVHWHIDYLLKEPQVRIDCIYFKVTDAKIECALAAEVSKRGVPMKRFGCSDCNCVSHLFRVKKCDFLSQLDMEVRYPSDCIM